MRHIGMDAVDDDADNTPEENKMIVILKEALFGCSYFFLFMKTQTL